MGEKEIVLDIQDVTQKINIESVGKKLSKMIIDKKEELLPDGNIKLTLILDPKIQEAKKNE